mgnify:CR=1 FL=1
MSDFQYPNLGSSLCNPGVTLEESLPIWYFQYPNLGSSLCNPLASVLTIATLTFQYPNLGSSLCNQRQVAVSGPDQQAFSILTSDRLSVTPAAGTEAPTAQAFSILTSDRLSVTKGGVASETHCLCFQYPNLGSSLCNIQAVPEEWAAHHAFQYPNLGSSLCNHSGLDGGGSARPFSILTSDRLSVTVRLGIYLPGCSAPRFLDTFLVIK